MHLLLQHRNMKYSEGLMEEGGKGRGVIRDSCSMIDEAVTIAKSTVKSEIYTKELA